MRCASVLVLAIWAVTVGNAVQAAPFIPPNDRVVLADVPPGAGHSELRSRDAARQRIDVALPLAQFYVQQARNTGDLRYLGYAESVLAPWVAPPAKSADALVLHATVLQSRHEFNQALGVLEQARVLRPDDPQSWLTSATVLRVLGRYDESVSACGRLGMKADPSVTELCTQGARALMGSLESAYDTVAAIDTRTMTLDQRAWRDSELGEMAVRMGRDADAERWFASGLKSSPKDFYTRAAYADLLLRTQRSADALRLLQGQETLEPLLLRIAIAQKMEHDPKLQHSAESLAASFAAEAQRGEEVHRREQARFLLDVSNDPGSALTAAIANWQVQHETEDVLILIRAAAAAGRLRAADAGIAFVRKHGIQDVRIEAAIAGGRS